MLHNITYKKLYLVFWIFCYFRLRPIQFLTKVIFCSILSTPSKYNLPELIRRISQNDEAAFQELFYLYWNKIYSVAFILSKSVLFAEDVAQETLLWVWKERGKLPQIDNFSGYLHIVARNAVYRKLKQIQTEEAYKNYMAGRVVFNDTNSSEDLLHAKKMQNLLQEAINNLPAQQQMAFRLSREQGLSHAEIAVAMNLSQNSIKDYIVKATSSLRKQLKKYAEFRVLLPFL